MDETSPCCTGCMEQLSVAQRVQRVEVVVVVCVLLLDAAVEFAVTKVLVVPD